MVEHPNETIRRRLDEAHATFYWIAERTDADKSPVTYIPVNDSKLAMLAHVWSIVTYAPLAARAIVTADNALRELLSKSEMLQFYWTLSTGTPGKWLGYSLSHVISQNGWSERNPDIQFHIGIIYKLMRFLWKLLDLPYYLVEYDHSSALAEFLGLGLGGGLYSSLRDELKYTHPETIWAIVNYVYRDMTVDASVVPPETPKNPNYNKLVIENWESHLKAILGSDVQMGPSNVPMHVEVEFKPLTLSTYGIAAAELAKNLQRQYDNVRSMVNVLWSMLSDIVIPSSQPTLGTLERRNLGPHATLAVTYVGDMMVRGGTTYKDTADSIIKRVGASQELTTYEYEFVEASMLLYLHDVLMVGLLSNTVGGFEDIKNHQNDIFTQTVEVMLDVIASAPSKFTEEVLMVFPASRGILLPENVYRIFDELFAPQTLSTAEAEKALKISNLIIDKYADIHKKAPKTALKPALVPYNVLAISDTRHEFKIDRFCVVYDDDDNGIDTF